MFSNMGAAFGLRGGLCFSCESKDLILAKINGSKRERYYLE